MRDRFAIGIALAIALFTASPGYSASAGSSSSLGGIWTLDSWSAPQPAADSRSLGEIAYSDFLARVEENAVSAVIITGQDIAGTTSDGQRFQTTAPDDPGLIAKLIDHRVRITAAPNAASSSLFGIAANWLPILLTLGVIIFLIGGMRGRSGSANVLSFGQSRARRQQPSDSGRVTFGDVAGIDEAKDELKEIVEFLRDPGKFRCLGGKIPRGCLLAGPPGTGKTLLARAIAGEANVPFFTISGSDFVEMFVGVGASRVRNLFAQAKKEAPCIVFIDEIDAVGRRRGAGLGGGNDEREQTLNQLLVEMDGFEGNEGVILIAATNRPDVLDPALLRPGRFDRQVVVASPDVAGREQILAVHLRKVALAKSVEPKLIARGTPGFTGADLANLVNEAALLAAHRGNLCVTMAELDAAKDKVMMGAERRSLSMTEREKETTAYHEAGHALVAFYSPGNDPLYKVTIVPRGRALGLTLSLPERDRHGFAKNELEARLAMMFGGRVAEELIFGEDGVTTGAADDIRRASELARRMVTEFGFSEKLGPLSYCEDQGEVFLGHTAARHANVSEETARLIDDEVRRIVAKGEAEARHILEAHMPELRRFAAALIEHETLGADDIAALLDRDAPDDHRVRPLAA